MEAGSAQGGRDFDQLRGKAPLYDEEEPTAQVEVNHYALKMMRNQGLGMVFSRTKEVEDGREGWFIESKEEADGKNTPFTLKELSLKQGPTFKMEGMGQVRNRSRIVS